MKNSMEVPQKSKNKTTLWSSNPTFGYISKGNKVTILKKYLYSHDLCSIIYINQDVETTHVSVSRWTDKENAIYYIYECDIIYDEILFSLKEILTFNTTWRLSC